VSLLGHFSKLPDQNSTSIDSPWPTAASDDPGGIFKPLFQVENDMAAGNDILVMKEIFVLNSKEWLICSKLMEFFLRPVLWKPVKLQTV